MSIPIGTKPLKQKSKTHLQKKPYITQKKNLYKALLNSTMNNDLCISQTYSNDNVKTSRLQVHDTHIVTNKGEINTGESNENENVHKFNESVVSKKLLF
jgi:hypothetical protein